jgi:predicted permease
MGIQVATALLVLIAAGMFFRGFQHARNADPGFTRDGVLLAAYDFSGRGASDADVRTFAARLLDALRALPGVGAAAIASNVPLDIHGLPPRAFALEGRARADAASDQALSNVVTPGYFAVMDIRILAGSDFADLNSPAGAAQAIVNEAFVQRYLAGAEPLGRRVDVRGRSYTIVGVAEDSRYNAFDEPPTPIVYFSWRDLPSRLGEVHVRVHSRGDETSIAADVRRIVRNLDAELPVFNVRTMNEHVDANLVFRRIPARMFSVLAPLLLALTSIGIYAVVAYTVSLRTTEIGVRMALGATPARVVAQLVGESLAVVASGALAGWAIAFLGARNLAASRSGDLLSFVGVPIVLLGVAALACWLPARRAARLDPMAALRAE